MDEYTTQQSYLLMSAFHIKRRGAALVQVTPEAAGFLPASIELGQVNSLNHLLEQDHRFLKRVVKPGMGFFSMETAGRTLQGYEVMKRIRKGQVHGVGKGDIKERVTFRARLLAGAASAEQEGEPSRPSHPFQLFCNTSAMSWRHPRG